VNGDGYSDVAIAAPRYLGGEGVVFVYHGSASGISEPATTALRAFQANALFGSGGVSTAGDFDGDGYSDVVVGAPNFANGQSLEGAAFLFLGSATGIVNPTGTIGTHGLDGNQIGGSFGGAVSGVGDVNGDGLGDLLIGSPGYDDRLTAFLSAMVCGTPARGT